jgi:hypothetical protein
MNKELFEQVFDNTDSKWEGDNCYKGLQIIAKYTDNIVQGATHDKVYSADIDKLIEAGITEGEVKELALLNWMIEDGEYLACFV